MKTFLFWLLVLCYALGMVLVGVLIQRRRAAHRLQGDLPQFEFWIAQRQLPGWWLAVSITAGWLMLGWIGFGMSQIYQYGATGLWILPIPWLVLCFIIVAAAPFFRRMAAVSVPQALGQRFGPGMRTLAALFSFFVFIAWTQAELFMAGTLMSPFLGVPPWVCMIVMVVPIIVYTYLGGFRAIVMTDVLQFMLMAAFMIVLTVTAVCAARTASGGNILAALRTTAPPLAGAGKTFSLWSQGWLFPVMLFIGYLPGWLIEQDLALRLQAAKSTREARSAAWLGLVLIGLFVIVLPSIIAFCALVAFPPANGAPHAAVGTGALEIISAFIAQLPAWLVGFMLVGIVACQMSTIDTFAQVSAMPIAYDCVEPLLQRMGASSVSRMKVAQVISVGVLVVALVLALWSTSLNDVYYISSGVLSACIALPAFLMFWKRTTMPAVAIGSLAGFVTTIGAYWFEYKWLQAADAKAAHYYTDVLPSWLHGTYGYHYIAAGVVMAVVCMVAISLVTHAASPAKLATVQSKPVDNRDEFLAATFSNKVRG